MTAAAPDAQLLQQLQRLREDDPYWMATCYTIRDKYSRTGKLHLNWAQRDVLAREAAQLATKGNARQYILKARQAGFTTVQQAKSLKLVTTTPGIDALTIADKQKRTDKIYQITERALKYFPKALLPRMGNRRSKEVSFPDMESNFFTDTAGGGDPARGLTLGRLHCSEFAYFESPREVLSAAVPSLVPQGSVVVLETTASLYEDEAHQFWREAEQGANGYEAVFYPWWQADPEGYRTPLLAPDELGPLEEDEQQLVTVEGLVPEQIKWRRAQIREFGLAYFLREYAEDPESCWMAAGQLYYDMEVLKHLLRTAPTGSAEDGLTVYRATLPPGTRRVILGGDTAEGGGGAGDRFTFEVRAEPSWALLATYESTTATPEAYADTVVRVASRWGKPLLVIEKNAHGITVLRRLRDHHHWPAERLYHRMTYDHNAATPTMQMGWYTSQESKAYMLDAGRQVLMGARNGHFSCPAPFVKDAFAVRYNKEGRVVLTGRDAFVAGTLCWIGREYPHLPLGGAALPPTIIR